MKNNKKTLDIKKIKRQVKGITLIALVVTIIVLLILAAVAINLTIGNNGIFTRAQNATQKWEEASKNEQDEMDKVSNFLDEYINGKDQSGTGEGTLVNMFKQAQKDGCLNLDGTCDNPNHLHIGDYVNYQNPTSGTYTITGEKSGMNDEDVLTRATDQTYDVRNNQLNWRVLGIDEKTGGIKLIAGSPMKLNDIEGKDDPYLYLRGAEAYVYGPDEMNKACAMYKNEYAQEARSISIEDINQIAGIKTEGQIKEYNAFPAMGGATQYGEEYGPFENQYTPETWLNGKQETTVKGKTTGYAFMVGEQMDGAPFKMLDIKNTRAKSMLFDNVEYGKGKAYWLASRGACAYPDDGFAGFYPGIVIDVGGVTMAGFGRDTFFSDGGEYNVWFAVRPVVSLKSNITRNEISRIPDKTEEEWNYDAFPAE